MPNPSSAKKSSAILHIKKLLRKRTGWTLYELQGHLHALGIYVSESNVGARVRDLRKRPHCMNIVCRQTEGRRFEYRLGA